MNTLTHQGSKALETEHFILRKFKGSDAPLMFENWANDEDVTRYLTWLPHENVEVTKGLCEQWEKDAENNNCYQWAMIFKENNEPIGSIAAVEFDEVKSEAYIGYCMSKKYWGKGYMTECFKEVIRFLFDEIGFETITSIHDIDNPASGKVMLKCGMSKIRSGNRCLLNNKGKEVETVDYLLTKKDWLEMRKL